MAGVMPEHIEAAEKLLGKDTDVIKALAFILAEMKITRNIDIETRAELSSMITDNRIAVFNALDMLKNNMDNGFAKVNAHCVAQHDECNGSFRFIENLYHDYERSSGKKIAEHEVLLAVSKTKLGIVFFVVTTTAAGLSAIMVAVVKWMLSHVGRGVG